MTSLGIVEQVVNMKYSLFHTIHWPSAIRSVQGATLFHCACTAATTGLVICLLTYALSVFQFRQAKGEVHMRLGELRLPTIPHVVPLLFNALELAWSPSNFLDKVMWVPVNMTEPQNFLTIIGNITDVLALYAFAQAP
ncbi:hypothetical protein DPSP01_006162 [Paraphaeosphaeria sporulosa]